MRSSTKKRWAVYYGKNFWSTPRPFQHAGRELRLDRHFDWGAESWQVPAIYRCGEGLAVDFCVRVCPERIRDFIDKWDLLHEEQNQYTRAQREEMERENPLQAEFAPSLILNGRVLAMDQGSSTSWLPESCLPDTNLPGCAEKEQMLEHYGLDRSCGWRLHRYFFRWATKRAPVFRTLELKLERFPVFFPVMRLAGPSEGEQVSFVHPVSGKEYRLTVQQIRSECLDPAHFSDPGTEYPTHFLEMFYTLTPDLPSDRLTLQDLSEGDRPRRKNPPAGRFVPADSSYVGIMGIIGGTDGPTALFCSSGKAEVHASCSSLYFELPPKIDWQLSCREKMVEDLTVSLL